MNPYINFTVSAIRKAGSIVIRYMDRLDRVATTRKGRDGYVSDVDKAAEDILVEQIQKKFPHHSILSEESGIINASEGHGDSTKSRNKPGEKAGDRYEWIIDPLGGTLNFLHGYPHFCISMALRINDVVQHGVILDPLKNELFTASKGEGTQLNNRRVRVSGQRQLSSSIITTSKAHQGGAEFNIWSRCFTHIVQQCGSFRASGCAALDLAYVASGRIDGFWQPNLKVWDCAAGILMVREAGGFVADFAGEQDFLQNGNLVAGNASIFNSLLSVIKTQSTDKI